MKPSRVTSSILSVQINDRCYLTSVFRSPDRPTGRPQPSLSRDCHDRASGATVPDVDQQSQSQNVTGNTAQSRNVTQSCACSGDGLCRIIPWRRFNDIQPIRPRIIPHYIYIYIYIYIHIYSSAEAVKALD